MFLILTHDEYDSQSSMKAWQAWYPYKHEGFETREKAEKQIANHGTPGERYWIVEVKSPVTPVRTTVVQKVEAERH